MTLYIPCQVTRLSCCQGSSHIELRLARKVDNVLKPTPTPTHAAPPPTPVSLTHTRTHARTHAHTHTHAHMHAHTHTLPHSLHTCQCVYALCHAAAHTHTHTHARTHTHMHAHAHTCTHTHTHARTRTHMHAHAHIPPLVTHLPVCVCSVPLAERPCPQPSTALLIPCTQIRTQAPRFTAFLRSVDGHIAKKKHAYALRQSYVCEMQKLPSQIRCYICWHAGK